jgi:hypothetical protein
MNQQMPSFVARDYLKQLRSQANITPSFILHDGTTAGDFALAYLRQKDQAFLACRKKDVDLNQAIKKSAKRKQKSSKRNHESSKKSSNGSAATTKTNLHHTTKDAV